jgi:hypothetical protein
MLGAVTIETGPSRCTLRFNRTYTHTSVTSTRSLGRPQPRKDSPNTWVPTPRLLWLTQPGSLVIQCTRSFIPPTRHLTGTVRYLNRSVRRVHFVADRAESRELALPMESKPQDWYTQAVSCSCTLINWCWPPLCSSQEPGYLKQKEHTRMVLLL